MFSVGLNSLYSLCFLWKCSSWTACIVYVFLLNSMYSLCLLWDCSALTACIVYVFCGTACIVDVFCRVVLRTQWDSARADTFFSARSRLLSISLQDSSKSWTRFLTKTMDPCCRMTRRRTPADKSLLLVFLLYFVLLKLLEKRSKLRYKLIWLKPHVLLTN